MFCNSMTAYYEISYKKIKILHFCSCIFVFYYNKKTEFSGVLQIVAEIIPDNLHRIMPAKGENEILLPIAFGIFSTKNYENIIMHFNALCNLICPSTTKN